LPGVTDPLTVPQNEALAFVEKSPMVFATLLHLQQLLVWHLRSAHSSSIRRLFTVLCYKQPALDPPILYPNGSHVLPTRLLTPEEWMMFTPTGVFTPEQWQERLGRLYRNTGDGEFMLEFCSITDSLGKGNFRQIAGSEAFPSPQFPVQNVANVAEYLQMTYNTTLLEAQFQGR
jgi:hypothetical protein